MANRPHDQTWLDMAILDLRESKQTGAVALEQARILLEEKVLLKEKLNVERDSWNLEKQGLEEDLVQTKKEHEGKSIVQAYEIAALHVSLGSQQQEALCFKLRLEGAVDEVELLFSRLQVLNVQLQEKEVQICEAHKRHLHREANLKQRLVQEKPTDKSQQEAAKVTHLVHELKRKHEIDVEKLKSEQCALSLQRKQEVSALIREKNFVWDQLKRMEDDYSSRLDTKKQELKSAEETLQKLQMRVDELQRAHDEKTVEATVLRINVQAAEEELLRLKDDLAQLKPSGQIVSNSELTSLALRNSNGSCEEVEGIRNQQELPTMDDAQATKLLAEKEEELKKAKKLMDELRLENQNLRLLYADLEGQLKDKQKPEKANRESAKDATTRNLTADLEAVAAVGTQTSSKAHAELKRRRLLAPDSCAEGASQRSEQPTPIYGDGSKSMEPLSSNDEIKVADKNEQSSIHLSQQSLESKSELTGSARLARNRLFSSVFGIPKVLAGT